MASYKIKSGDTLGAIASQYKTDVSSLLKSNPNISDPNKIFAGASLNVPDAVAAPAAPSAMTSDGMALQAPVAPPAAAPKVAAAPAPKPDPVFPITNIASPTPAPTPVTAPTLPTPTAPAANEAYFASATDNLANSKSAYEKALAARTAQLDQKKAAGEADVAALEEEQAQVIDKTGGLLEPFRQNLEQTQREQLHVNENFEANQNLTNELDRLLTEGNDLIKAKKAQPLALSVLNKTTAKTMSDITARTGVIQAVMAARSNQITDAERLIDRSVAAITADRKDQLSYYETVYNFYEGQKKDKQNQVISLDKEQSDFVKQKISDLKDDVTRATTSADYIKKLMTDPDKALFMAKAGVTLNDTPETINQKMAAQAETDEVNDFKNDRMKDGYQFVPFPGTRTDVVTFDVNGQKLSFKAPASKTAIYTEKNVPGDVRSSIIDDLQNTDMITTGGEDPLETLARLYPEVSTAGLQALIDEFYNYDELLKKKETADNGGVEVPPWWKFWK